MSNISIKTLISHIHKRFFLCSATFSSSSSAAAASYTAEFLVNSLGIPLKSAFSVSQKIQIYEKNQQIAQSVVQFFKSHHFSDTQVAELIVKYPPFLHSNVKDTLQPKFDYFLNNGFTGERLCMLIMSNYQVLLRSLDSQIKPSIEFWSWCLDSVPVSRFSWLLTCNLEGNIQSNLELLRNEGVPVKNLGKFIALGPRPITQAR
ncbi:hypothetical protein M5689_007717 [Euphorbia peplus]|nr:hypothetical protein M5689_007717 [Euphorbia peplus]